MKNRTISFGHKNPDTDSVLSAIVVSRFGKSLFGREIAPAVAGDINNESKYVLNLLKIKKPKLLRSVKNQDVVLIDTTEPKQIIEGLTEDNLFAVIDHHNLGGVKSSKPIYLRVEPVGCTATVIHKILKEKKIKTDKTSAILMLSSIISDTLYFSSPTTTSEDKKAVRELNAIAKVDLKGFSNRLFEAKSSLKGISSKDIIGKDFKNFEMGKSKVGIAVWETTMPETVNDLKRNIVDELLHKKESEGLDYIFFAVVDILKSNSYLYICTDNEKNLAQDVFSGTITDNLMMLKGVVSRKKQLVPPLMNKLGKK